MTEAIEKVTDSFGIIFFRIPGRDYTMGRCTVTQREWLAVIGTETCGSGAVTGTIPKNCTIPSQGLSRMRERNRKEMGGTVSCHPCGISDAHCVMESIMPFNVALGLMRLSACPSSGL